MDFTAHCAPLKPISGGPAHLGSWAGLGMTVTATCGTAARLGWRRLSQEGAVLQSGRAGDDRHRNVYVVVQGTRLQRDTRLWRPRDAAFRRDCFLWGTRCFQYVLQ